MGSVGYVLQTGVVGPVRYVLQTSVRIVDRGGAARGGTWSSHS